MSLEIILLVARIQKIAEGHSTCMHDEIAVCKSRQFGHAQNRLITLSSEQINLRPVIKGPAKEGSSHSPCDSEELDSTPVKRGKYNSFSPSYVQKEKEEEKKLISKVRWFPFIAVILNYRLLTSRISTLNDKSYALLPLISNYQLIAPSIYRSAGDSEDDST